MPIRISVRTKAGTTGSGAELAPRIMAFLNAPVTITGIPEDHSLLIEVVAPDALQQRAGTLVKALRRSKLVATVSQGNTE